MLLLLLLLLLLVVVVMVMVLPPNARNRTRQLLPFIVCDGATFTNLTLFDEIVAAASTMTS